MSPIDKHQKLLEQQTALIKAMEKPIWKSRKFMAWLLFQGLMFTLGLVALKWQNDLGWPLSAFMVGIVFSMGITTMWFLGKQAATDIYSRGFAMIGKEATYAVMNKETTEVSTDTPVTP